MKRLVTINSCKVALPYFLCPTFIGSCHYKRKTMQVNVVVAQAVLAWPIQCKRWGAQTSMGVQELQSSN